MASSSGWYYVGAENGERTAVGPFDDAAFLQFIEQGVIAASTLVYHPLAAPQWIQACRLPTLKDRFVEPPPVALKPARSVTPLGTIEGPGKYEVAVVGESNYQDALTSICGWPTFDGVDLSVNAVLVPENDNPHDKDATRVDIRGHTVGYLGRENARQYRRQLEAAGYANSAFSVSARIRGGWDRGDNDVGLFGVRLGSVDI